MEKLESIISTPEIVKIHEESGKHGKVKLEKIFGEKVFVKDVKERIKTFQDALSATGETLDAFNHRTALDSADEKAFKQVKVIVAALNEGWYPDWDNSNQYKYYPWFKLSSSGVGFSYHGYNYDNSLSAVGSRLVFKTSDLAKYAGNQFLSIYKSLLTI